MTLLPFRPHCCVCNKPVDEFLFSRNSFSDSTTYLARCHGQTEECELSRETLYLWATGEMTIERFEAFKTPKLPEQPKELPAPEGTWK